MRIIVGRDLYICYRLRGRQITFDFEQ